MDASRAILLAKAELLDAFLEGVEQTVAMPSEVREECSGRDSLDGRLIARAIEEKRIAVKVVERRAIQRLMSDFGLGTGRRRLSRCRYQGGAGNDGRQARDGRYKKEIIAAARAEIEK